MNCLKKIYCRAYQFGFRIAMPFLPYRVPVQMDGLDEIPSLFEKKEIKSVLLVIDANVRKLGLTADFEALLEKTGIKFSVYEQANPNPTIENIENARSIYLDGNAQAIVAIGGGSAMDCAKVTGARVVCPNKPVQKMKGVMKILKKTPLLIAVPTTAGTGSEVTLAAVITDGETHHKYPINDFNLIPDYAVLDPALTLGLPASVTSTTGLDALTHAVEAYIGGSTTKFTRKMSIEAVTLIKESLETAVETGSDVEARKKMLKAAYCAGASFTRSYVGYVHGVAHSLGGAYGIAHGLANAVILPVFLRIYGKSCEKKLADLAVKSGVAPSDISTADAAERFIAWIEGMNKKFNLPAGFEQIKEEDIKIMAENADKESNPLYPVPLLMDAKELESVYRKLIIK